MLTRDQFREMVVLTQRVQAGSVDREDWSNFATLTLIAQGDATVLAIAGSGLDTFIAVSRDIYEGHGFQHDDYRRIYARICAAATHIGRPQLPN